VGDGVQKEEGVKQLQTPFLPALPEKKYAFPTTARAGPSYPNAPDEEKEKKSVDPIVNKSTSTTSLQLEQTGTVDVSQGYADNGIFGNGIQASFEMINMGDEKIIIKSVEAHYYNKSDWIACDYTNQGRRQGNYFTWDPADAGSRTVEPQTPYQIAFGASINVKSKQLNPLKRVHSSLPIPLEVRWTLTDVKGAKTIISVKADNDSQPLELVSRASQLAYYSSYTTYSLIAFISADDLEVEGRAYLTCWKDTGYSAARFEFQQSVGSGHTIDLESIHKIAYLASKEGKDEYPIAELTRKGTADHEIATFALVDRDLRRVYGFKTTLTTNTSSVTDSFPIEY